MSAPSHATTPSDGTGATDASSPSSAPRRSPTSPGSSTSYAARSAGPGRGDARRGRGGSRPQPDRRRAAEAVPAQVARHVRRRALRARRGARGRSARVVPDARARARERGALLRPVDRRLLHDDGARPLHASRRTAAARRFAHAVAERLLPLATSRLVIENEFRTDLEPELWDGDELTARDRRGRPAARRARPAAGAVPDRGAALRARAAARLAPLRHRRPLVRQPLGAQGRRPLLDERERRRQVEARRARTATSCSSRATTRPTRG